ALELSLDVGDRARPNVAAVVRREELSLDRRGDRLLLSGLRSHEIGRPAGHVARGGRIEHHVLVNGPAVRVVEAVDDADDLVLVSVGVLETAAEGPSVRKEELRERLADDDVLAD